MNMRVTMPHQHVTHCEEGYPLPTNEKEECLASMSVLLSSFAPFTSHVQSREGRHEINYWSKGEEERQREERRAACVLRRVSHSST